MQQESVTAACVAARIETVFHSIQQTRMADVPILNHRLAVAAVGTQAWAGKWLSILVTPWCMNILILPDVASSEGWTEARPGDTVKMRLPSGTYSFIAGTEPELGPFLMCSLFSPMLEFVDQAAAIATAEAAMGELLTPPEPKDTPAKETGAVSRSRRSLFGLDKVEAGR
ncbi:[NiFe]-hydrogenase assembly chaperone HybE [Dongia sp.]|uniref:[NiFe]-hydrogenase assembly chaperone HybE n=1 Tax=Dongia sp. TaxID=1977262 RepID=UPI0035B34F88